MQAKNSLFFIMFFPFLIVAKPYPIQFSISETKMIKEIPEKTRDFAFIVPGKAETFIYDYEEDYFKGYQNSYYAITMKKAGWDCLRHYEILINGCIPYFIDLDKSPSETMAFLPKDLIREAMNLEGVSYLHIDHSKFNKEKYFEILNKLMEYTRNTLTSKKIAEYVLRTINYTGSGKILFLSSNIAPDYLRCCTLIGFKELFGDRVIDYPKIPHIYKSYPHDLRQLYGKGMSYTKVLEDLPIDRENIEQRIKNKEFDLIIYGSIHRSLLLYELVSNYYEPEKIIYLCGEDAHNCGYSNLSNLFLRESDAAQ